MYFIYVFLGVLTGVLSGMGLGGGTILIPILTTFLSLSQKQSQFLNLFSFFFMSIFVSILNIKSKMVEVFPALIFSIVGLIFSFLSSFLVKSISNRVLQIIFGLFLLGIGLFEIYSFVKEKKQTK